MTQSRPSTARRLPALGLSAQTPVSAVVGRAAVPLDGRHLRRLPEEVRRELMRYLPQIPDREWTEIRDFVLDAVAAASTIDPKIEPQRAVKIAAPFVQWAVNMQGLPQEAAEVFTRAIIGAYCDSLTPSLAQRSVATYRSVLLAVANAIAPDTNPVPLAKYGRQDIQTPYTSEELEQFRAWSRGQSSDDLTQKAQLLLSLAAGAGLRPNEITALQPEDITSSISGVTVTIRGGESPRDVTVLAEWEGMFLEAVAGCAPEKPLWGQRRRPGSNPRNLLSEFYSRCNGLSPLASRLRSSWLTVLLDSGVHMTVVFKAAGFTKFNNLDQYLQYLSQVSAQDARAQLRGGRR